MRVYVAVNGILFGLIVVAHVARLGVEGLGPVHEPIFLLSSLLSVGMFVWSVRVFLRLGRTRPVAHTTD